MTAVLQDPPSVVNFALARAGYRPRVGSLYDGTLAAKKALDVYSQTRDELLRAGDWNFAMKNATGVASGGVVPYPWAASYAYPTDCLKVRSIYDSSATTDPFNPLPTTWTIYDDPVYGKVILTRATTATIIYTSQVTNPAQWDAMFIGALSSALGRNLRALAEKDDANFVKLTDEEVAATTQMANETLG
jgi:hypothetical protein